MLRSLKKLARGFMIVFTTFFVEIIETLRAESKLRSKLKLSCSSVEEDIDPCQMVFRANRCESTG